MSDHDGLERWVEAGWLDQTTDDDDERARIVAWLEANGWSPSQFAGIARDTNLALQANRRMYRPDQRHTRAEALELSGLSPSQFERLASIMGFPEEQGPVLTPVDIEALRRFSIGSDQFSEDELTHFVRVLTSAMARIAEAAVSLFHDEIDPDDPAGTDVVAGLERNREAAGALALIDAPIAAMLALQLQRATDRSDATRQFGHSSVDMAVGFVDLVGFTSLSESAPMTDLAQMVRTFESVAFDVVTGHGGHVVKLIGDEVMFVAVDAAAAVEISCGLLDALGASVAEPRAGLSFGPMLTTGGDYYGRTVNLAARLAARADAGEIWCDTRIAEQCPERRFESLGALDLRGFAEPIVATRLVD